MCTSTNRLVAPSATGDNLTRTAIPILPYEAVVRLCVPKLKGNAGPFSISWIDSHVSNHFANIDLALNIIPISKIGHSLERHVVNAEERPVDTIT